MSRHKLVASAALAVASLALAAPTFAEAAATPLTGTVGPGFTITLAKGGKKVTSLKAGSYSIKVTDKAAIHDFHLLGPGVNKVITTVPFEGTKTVTVTLDEGHLHLPVRPARGGGDEGHLQGRLSASGRGLLPGGSRPHARHASEMGTSILSMTEHVTGATCAPTVGA